MSEAPRFEAIELTYGCHDSSFSFHGEARPVLITGMNGSGKSTLAEALLRALFGFHRKSVTEREVLQLRRPWSGQPMRAMVGLRSRGVSHAIERDFETDEVTVLGADGITEFAGTVRPEGSGARDFEYRSLLRDWLGFGKLEPLVRTVWVRQGDLGQTELGDELLRIADGGHRAVGGAQKQLSDAFYKLSRQAFEPGSKRRARNGRLDAVAEEIAGLEEELRAAQLRESERRPLIQRRDELGLQSERLDREIAALEAALGPLNQRETLHAQLRELQRIHRQAEDLLNALRDAHRQARTARAQAADFDELTYPADFESRAEALRVLWDERRHLQSELAAASESPAELAPGPRPQPLGAPIPAWIFGAGLVVGLALIPAAGLGTGAAVALLGLALAVFRVALDRRRTERATSSEEPERYAAKVRERLTELEQRIEEKTSDVPESGTLTPDTLTDRLRHHRWQTKVMSQRAETSALADRLSEQAIRFVEEIDLPRPVESAFQLQGDFFVAPVAPAEPGASEDSDDQRAEEDLSDSIRAVVHQAATVQVQLDGVSMAGHNLPEGIAPEVGAVERALSHLRRERRESGGELTELELELARRRHGARPSLVVEQHMCQLRDEEATCRSEAEALRAAYRLITEAHARFQAEDQTRLLELISGRLAGLTGARLGPVESNAGLEDAVVCAGDRRLPLTCPPLSYGELHSALLAVRLGSADFLADLEIQPPLLVDEPFAYLDVGRAQEVWSLLCQIAASRQVIVTSQDRLMLEYLGANPDIELGAPGS